MELSKPVFERRIAYGDRILIDLSVLMAYFDGRNAAHDIAVQLFDDAVHNGRNPVIVSALTAMDFLVFPLRSAPRAVIHVHDFLTHWPNLSVVPFDLNIAQTSASLRAHHELNPPDAIVIATGIIGEADHLLTSDPGWNHKLASLSGHLSVCELRSLIA